ncbi:MFS general substrate transporter [Cryphonectria parasitica EP155]|uniref:Autophagy-related protein n=1 Tax=Cryphonectria parasitica (strain ATCC 38755 / EP155) TaxID=660469 RepID=A0A9P4XWL8_CRYP1|nr:MFS general substrate transporter [Cryphonectria parasitica EP155]KAF3762358.1 MFS general substrate transporter [Cryphonectria parasitica EP155]
MALLPPLFSSSLSVSLSPSPRSSQFRQHQQQSQQQQRRQQQPPLLRFQSSQSYASKKSFLSQGSGIEADDELSRDSDDDTDSDTMSPRIGSSAGTPVRYPGEDTRPTSSRELRGWYMYAFAAETYVICGSFIPILLESLARENGTLLKNGKPCGPSNDKMNDDGKQCVVHVLGVEINTASFAMYTFSISVLLQALLVVSISSAADHGQYRKKLLLSFAWIGSASVMLYIFISKNLYILGSVLAIISNVAFGASFVLLNSFLPLLVRHHPRMLWAGERAGSLASDEASDTEETQIMEDNNSTTGLLRDEARNGLVKTMTHEDQTSLELKLSTEISAKGIGIGYAAGLFVQCVAILILVKMNSTTWSLRVVLFIIGAWWAMFTVPAAFWLRPRPGPPLPAGENRKGLSALVSYTAFAWKSLYKTVKLARQLVDIVLFLGAWFLLSDAIATSSSTAILFAKTSLQMESWALGLISVISTTTGIAGALSWSYISRRFNLKPHQTLLACIGLFELIPLYGLLGYLPFVQAWGVGGLQQPWEMFPLAAVYGFVMGGLSSYCRAVYGELIPPGSEAAFYALYAITDKGSSVFGPFIVASIIEATGEIRPAFWFLAVLVGLPAPLIYFVDAERGKLEAERLADVIDDMRTQQGDRGESPREPWENQAIYIEA